MIKNLIENQEENLQSCKKKYQAVDSAMTLPAIEKQVLDLWRSENPLNKLTNSGMQYSIYDGPPFANGLPHYGHLLTGFLKDVITRYQRMLGKKVDGNFGWDCHGLPAEMAAEKELSLNGTKEIENYGIDKFNSHCQESVLKYTKEWQKYVERQGRWVNFDNQYKTMDLKYMESVLWSFKIIYDKGLIYKAMRVMPYSWACETPVSDFETRLDNAYREKASKAVTITFLLKIKPTVLLKFAEQASFLVWTTTPWTLPSNLALAVGYDIDYAVVRHRGVLYIVAALLAPKYKNEIGDDIVATCTGKDLIGLHYEPIFPYFATRSPGFTVLAGDFVTATDGTGIVHVAPGFGEDDFKLCKSYGIELVCPVDKMGCFTSEVSDYEGKQVFEANEPIIQFLKDRGILLKIEQHLHNYPHCWRTDTPLIYRAVSSWYLKVTAIKDRMIHHNQKINWIPGHVQAGLFGKWLENARDWSISRNRYWGCPIPIWESDDPRYPHVEVYGSIAELSQAFGVKITNLHKPFIDELTKPNPSDPTCKSKLRRVPEVLDCWFESGSMPYAQFHYPFETERFKQNFPADFIVEYLAQTRGWFYTMLVLSTALFDQPPFKNCICHGVVLGSDNQKLSKRLQNYIDPEKAFESTGADAMRWFMLSSPVTRGQQLVIDNTGESFEAAARRGIKPLWNAYSFFVLYANIDGIEPAFDLTSNSLLDRYIIGLCKKTVISVKSQLDLYDTVDALHIFEGFLETLNNWYIRRSRQRFWSKSNSQSHSDKIKAYNTLYAVLHIICRAVAPFMPFVSDAIFRGITGRSVHFEAFPEFNSFDEAIITEMEKIRNACNAALHIRNENNLRTRQPLAKVTFIGVTSSPSDEMIQLVLDEINVKEWHNVTSDALQDFANLKLKLNLKALAERIPHMVQECIKLSKSGNWLVTNGVVQMSDITLKANEFELVLEPKPEISKQAFVLENAMVLLDLELTDELLQEGIARDLIRLIQVLRKNSGLDVTDKISLILYSNTALVQESIRNYQNYITEQTLAQTCTLHDLNQEPTVTVANGYKVAIKLEKTVVA